MTGQIAAQVAKEFKNTVDLTGIILTRADGDGRGGAAVSMKFESNVPIKFLGIGEKIENLEVFHPDRIANRILGMGDVVSLVEKAAETIAEEDAEKMMQRLSQGSFDMNDMLKQIGQLKKLGGLSGVMSMLPGIGKLQKQMAAHNFDDKVIAKQEAIIYSMTKKERVNVGILNASRRKRIASGSGSSVHEVNRLVKQQQDMARMMKKVGKVGGMGALKNMFSGLGGNSESNMPNGMPGSIQEMQKMMGKLPMGGSSNKFSGMGLPGFSGKPSKRIK